MATPAQTPEPEYKPYVPLTEERIDRMTDTELIKFTKELSQSWHTLEAKVESVPMPAEEKARIRQDMAMMYADWTNINRVYSARSERTRDLDRASERLELNIDR